MTDFTCYVGLFSSSLELPVADLSSGWSSLPYHFARGARLSHGQTALRIRVDQTSRLRQAQLGDRYPTDVLYLQSALQRLTLNPERRGLVSNIGLLYADQLARFPRVLGVMFDAGFDLPGLRKVHRSYHSVPREGCAVFLTSIRRLRPGNSAYRRESIFTSVHELGHVFNLWHRALPFSFMSKSRESGAYPAGAFRFLPEHSLALRNVADYHIHPGGEPLGSRGPFSPVHERNPLNAPRSQRPLRLRIALEPRSFWHFEPVELEVRLELARGSRRSARVPLELDPGYERFVIWIEEPNGCVRRYRSPRHYCKSGETRQVTRSKRYARDISIFGESGGHTFREAGTHRLWATFELPDGSVLTSNCLECEIRTVGQRGARDRRVREALTHRGAARLLYYRGGNAHWKTVDVLEDLLHAQPGEALSSSVEYALGRYHASASTRTLSRASRGHREAAARFLSRALDRSQLTPHRRLRAREVLERIRTES